MGGFTAMDQQGEGFDFYGPVRADENHEDWLGAQTQTNNTAELSAIIWALRWIYEKTVTATDTRRGSIAILYDSKYAAMLVDRKWRPKTNGFLVYTARLWHDMVK